MSEAGSVENSSKNIEFSKLISNRIETLRPKLLDFTRRNPLISTKFSDRSNSLVRIVDEIPEQLLNSIIEDEMRIVPLPDLGTDPKDEVGREFQSALAEARLNEEIYLTQLDEIDEQSDDAPDLLAKAERQLKDRLRERLRMPPRQTKNNLSLQQHAKNHGISPYYELFYDHQQHQDGRHTDKDIQTLLLPDVLDRRLNALMAKERTWKEETGIPVLHAAFGFLEWEDSVNSKSQYSPLILIPVQIEKKRSREGQEYWVSSEEGEIQENKILAEKLRLEMGITLPEYCGQGLENYFNEVADQSPKNTLWRVRRWACIGVFPSARMAMYYDLDTNGWDFSSHNVVSKLLGGSNTGHDALPFGDEYEVDEPEIENKVPYLITDADSSQFSTIVDVVDKKNLAVEGPPGTGKSQTIVNTIAASLATGMKVLFVAEKSAALEVVRSRLEAFGVGEFILPLMANRTSKDAIISSIRERIEMVPSSDSSELDHALARFKDSRSKLKSYVDILSSKHGETDFTIHTVLGCGIKNSELINNLPEQIRKSTIPATNRITSDKLHDIRSRCRQIEESYAETQRNHDYWKWIQVPNIDPFKANELLEVSQKVSKAFANAHSQRQSLNAFNIADNVSLDALATIDSAISAAPNTISSQDIQIVRNLNSTHSIDLLKDFLKKAKSWREYEVKLSGFFAIDLDTVSEKDLIKIRDTVQKYDLTSLAVEILDGFLQKRLNDLNSIKRLAKMYDQSRAVTSIFGELKVDSFLKALEIIKGVSKQALMIRKKELDDPTIQSLFAKQSEKVKLLLEKRIALNKQFELSALTDPETLTGYAKTISYAGAFSFLSGAYREAKKYYKSIAITSKYKKSGAVQEFRDLSLWKSGVNDFCNNEMIRTIVGPYYDGIDTDFTPFHEAIKFYQKIDQEFPGAQFLPLRGFLKEASNDEIQSLPVFETLKLSESDQQLLMNTIPDMAEHSQIAFDECKASIDSLKSLSSIFVESENISRDNFTNFPDVLVKLREIRTKLRNDENIKELLGAAFKGEKTTVSELGISLTLSSCIVGLEDEIRAAFLECAESNRLSPLKECIVVIRRNDTAAITELENLAILSNSSSESWIGSISFSEFSEKMDQASRDKNGLLSHSRFVSAKDGLIEYGYRNLVDSIYQAGRSDVHDIVSALIMREMARDAYQTYGGTLATFNGSNLELLRKQLQEADRKVITLSRSKLQSELYNTASPPHGVGVGKKSEYTELALLKHEASLKRNRTSVRSLTQRAGNALMELKPCWMMSPLAVAQYLPKGEIEFDLVIIDEASQMTPEDSIGALIRAKQAMVVGDTNQLPPTGFFRKVIDDEDADEDEKVTEESILEMANACFKPARRLRWHYRSRNSGLIAFSNKHVYNNDLVIFPSAQEDHPEMGVSYVKVEGRYSTGANPEEAKAMVDAIINFMSTHKDKSLGVVLLNQKQRDLLNDEMNYALEHYPYAREYIDIWDQKNDGLESFFIKNLENVQGDERDVIFIGTVYGPENKGVPVRQGFGPINGVAGKRRLNVLFSRAKQRIVTFSSMTASDIRAEEDGNPGAYMLKCWLEYSSTGVLERGKDSQKEPDSEFEEHVIQQIKSIGCEAIPQVGVKGYSIDIGVKHPDWPHGYIMGVECDGATYHSSKSARDRDRLRQEVLEGLGWYLYRIWSTDWFEDPLRETEKLRKIIEERTMYLQSHLNSVM